MISVCMATYCGEKYIREQITSILSQLSNEDELVVSDDGSKDNTISIIQSFNDQRIRLYNNEGKHGFVQNFENAMRHAHGDVIFLADQDDVWKPNKVNVVLNNMNNYDLVVHDAELIDGLGRSLGKSYYSTMHHNPGFLANFWKTRWLGCCMAFKREVLDYCLPFPEKIIAHDYWIGMLGMTKFKYHFMDDILILYRRHGTNVTSSGEKSNNSLYYKIITKRGNLLVSLIKKRVF